MNVISPGISSIVLVLLQLSVDVELLIVRRHYHDGLLYEDFAADSDSVRYTTTSGEGWDDLESLVATYNLRDKSMFCSRGPGAWLLYQEKDYQFGSMRQLKLLYGEHCVPADNVNSLQPLGAVYVNIEDTSAVIAFAEKYFAAKGETSRDTISQAIKSAIFVGTGNWTLEMDGKKTCITILNMGDVCLLEDLQNSFSGTGDQVSITKGCGEEDMEQYQLQTCYSTGYHLLTYDFDFNLPSMQNICSGDYDPADQAKEKFLEVVDLWMKRMNPKVETPSTVPNAAERLNTLNEMVKIMGKTCPGVSPAFLEIVKSIYLVHIKNGDLWNVTVTPDGTRIEQSHAKWSRAQAFIMQCGGINSGVEVGCTPDDISEMKNEKEIATIEDFLNGETYDYVIEHIWLLLNYVSTYCNFHMGFKNNDWSIFPLLFKRDFLYPLQEQWKNPGKWSTFYPVMFNGFEMEDERKSMISCVQAIIKLTPFYDPLARPPGFYRGNRTVDRDIVGGVTTKAPVTIGPVPPSTTTAAPTEAPTARRKRQEDSEEIEKKGKKAKSKKSKTVATTAAPVTLSTPITHHPTSKPPKPTKKSKKHKQQQPTIITIGTTSKPKTIETSATTAPPPATQTPTAIDSGVTTIEIGTPATTGNADGETKGKDKKKKKKKGKGKHSKKSKSKDGKENEEKKHGSKLLKSTVVEKQQPPVTEAENIKKDT